MIITNASDYSRKIQFTKIQDIADHEDAYLYVDISKIVEYGVDIETEQIDYNAVLEKAKEVKPKMIVAGASAYSRTIDFSKYREIADAVDAYLFVNMAHIAGLVAAGLHPNPVPYSDFVTTTTHKTLRGPRGGIILCKEQYAKVIDKNVFPGMQ